MSSASLDGKFVSKIVVRWYLVILIVIFMIALIGVGYKGSVADAEIAHNGAILRHVVATQCESENKASTATNDMITALAGFVQVTKDLSAADIAARKAVLSTLVKIPLYDCTEMKDMP